LLVAPIAYRADTATGLAVSVIDGLVSATEFHDFAREQDQDADWHATTRSLTGARTTRTPGVSCSELEGWRISAVTSPTRRRTGDDHSWSGSPLVRLITSFIVGEGV
jgi:hypothetical protein